MFRQLPGRIVALLRFTGIECFDKIKFTQNCVFASLFSGVDDTQISFAAGMCRSQDTSVFVHHIDQNPHRQPSQFQYPYLYTLRHNHQDMAGINGIVLDSFQHDKILMPLSFDIIFPFPVSIVRVVIGNQHSFKAQFLETDDIILDGDLSVHGSFLGVTVHIEFHFSSPHFLFPSPIPVPESHWHSLATT